MDQLLIAYGIAFSIIIGLAVAFVFLLVGTNRD